MPSYEGGNVAVECSHLRRLKHRHASERRLRQKFQRLAVAGVVELRHFQRHTVVFRGDQDLERSEVCGVGPQLLLCGNYKAGISRALCHVRMKSVTSATLRQRMGHTEFDDRNDQAYRRAGHLCILNGLCN